MDRICLDCKTTLKGRIDKKFCDDQCRSNYNNRLKADDYSYLKQVNQILKKNRAILKLKNPNGKTKIKWQNLAKVGFDFNFHTHIYTTQNGSSYIFCYEYGYLKIENDELLLVKREDK